MKQLQKIALTGAIALTCVTSFATTLTFDEFDASKKLIDLTSSSYGGFTWTNFGVSDATGGTGPGYATGIVSGANTAFNGLGNAATISRADAFTLNDAYFTAAWNDNLDLTVTGITADNQTFTKSLQLSVDDPLKTKVDVTFNWSNLKSVTFASSGGTPHAVYPNGKGGTQFAMDNLTFNAGVVPEPETYALLLAGMGLVGAAVRRRKATKA